MKINSKMPKTLINLIESKQYSADFSFYVSVEIITLIQNLKFYDPETVSPDLLKIQFSNFNFNFNIQ